MILTDNELGGAVAIDLVSKNPLIFKGLIVENTFSSIPDMIPAIYPAWSIYRKLTPCLWNKWESKNIIGSIDCPILFLVGKKDEIVPPNHSEILFDRSRFGKLKYFPYGFHDDTWTQKEYMKTITSFIDQKK